MVILAEVGVDKCGGTPLCLPAGRQWLPSRTAAPLRLFYNAYTENRILLRFDLYCGFATQSVK